MSNENKNAKQLIEEWEKEGDPLPPCWICWEVFHRWVGVARYCGVCFRGFCEGTHGNFSRRIGMCLKCGWKK